jgi:UTP--glucose-1-phosphate uridylyltransferase
MKAVIPAAGHGTRFLPLTKGQPKEMLPIVDKPAIQYVVAEAIAAGIDDIIIITGRDKRAIEDHFDYSFELESFLKDHGKLEELEEIERISQMVNIHYIRQKRSIGLGDAVYCARQHIGDEPFAVMLGDTIHVSPVPIVKQLSDVHKARGGSVIAVERVPLEDVRKYGIIEGSKVSPGLYEIARMVEKPEPSEAPSDIAVAGTYFLSPSIFGCIEETVPGLNGEIQLTDALKLLLRKEKVFGCEFVGKRYDVGDKLGWMKANIELTLQDPRFSREMERFMRDLLDRRA